MRVSNENIKTLPISDKEQSLLQALLDDLEEINKKEERPAIYIDWQDYHNEWSPERTDPCPDYYGYYTLRWSHDNSEMIGMEVTIYGLDMALCTLYNYVIYD